MKKLARILCALLAAACMAACCVGCDDEDKTGQSGSRADIGDVYIGMGILQLQDGRFELSEEGFIGSYQIDGDTIAIKCFDMTKSNQTISLHGQRTQEGLRIEGDLFEKMSTEKGLEGTYIFHEDFNYNGSVIHNDLILKLADGKLVIFKNAFGAGTYKFEGNSLTLTGEFDEEQLTLHGERKNKEIVIDDDTLDSALKNTPFILFEDWAKYAN